MRIKDKNPRFGAVCGVFLTIVFQVIFVISITEKVIGLMVLPVFSSSYATNKSLYMLIGLPFLIYAGFYFNKDRTNLILERFDKKNNVFSGRNIFFFFLLAIAPLIGAILLLKK